PHAPGQRYKKVTFECDINLDPAQFSTQLTQFHSNQLYEFSQWSQPDRFIHRQYPALTHLSIVSILPPEEVLTRYGLHQLPSLEMLTVTYGFGYFEKLGSQHIPLECTPPSAGWNFQYRTLKRLFL